MNRLHSLNQLRQLRHLRRKRIVVLLSTLGMAYGSASASAQDVDRSRMVDHSRALAQPMPASSEREHAPFAALAPSGLTLRERQVMVENLAPAAPAVHSVTLRDTLDGTNFESGRAELLPRARATLDALVARLAGKDKLRFKVVGHTDNQRIAARLKPIFPDNAALSQARALAVAGYLKDRLHLQAEAFSVAGRADSEPVADNRTPDGMAKNRRTEIEVWYDEAQVEQSAGAAKPGTRQVERMVEHDACAPVTAPVQPFSISVDGQPLGADSTQQEADRQRCVDVALEQANVQVKYDPMNASPALNVWTRQGAAVRGRSLVFASYTNYAFWLRHAEVRVFGAKQDTRSTPLAVLALPVGGDTTWTVPREMPDQLVYLLRVTDANGRFDETRPHALAVGDREITSAPDQPMSGWGENTLALHNIAATGGTVTISGSKVAPGQRVTALGIEAPVDANGRFALRQMLPAGPHTVQVAIMDDQGIGRTFSRNLSIADRDWFYVAMADITAGRDSSSGPARLVTGDEQHYDSSSWIDGRAAFYLKGKVKGEYLLTASADTREQPLRDLFSNFAAKDPNYLLRRIDPDRYYPVYGDDSTIVDDAPTAGKLYVRLARPDQGASIMWGNFQTGWTGTELTQYSRGLYGADARWSSAATTDSGEKRHRAEVFVAEPGTLPMREEFRGTGGSLYYLHHQDLTQGSERLWMEVRDRDSGLVIERRPLQAAQDYDINYLQGRVTLRAPMASVSDSSSLFRTSSLAGNPAYLVATYEYVPGLTAVRGSAAGVRAGSWLNDHVGVGVTAFHQGEDSSAQDLRGVDATLRYAPNTWLKAETARSRGMAQSVLSSASGGFDSDTLQSNGGRGDATRVQATADLADVGARGRLSAYWQDRSAGFSGPGQIALGGEATRQHGAAAVLPIGQSTEIGVNLDARDALSQSAKSAEAALRHKIDAQWGVSAGLRRDERSNHLTSRPTASPLLNQQGRRDDAVVRVDFRPLVEGQSATTGLPDMAATSAAAPAAASSLMGAITPASGAGSTARRVDAVSAAGVAGAQVPGLEYRDWSLYGFVQHTLQRTGDRSLGDRAGVGGSWQASERIKLSAEASGGSGGGGGQLGASYKVSERSDVYLAYTLETESPNVNYAGREGALTGGTHYRVNEQTAVFAESRWQNGAGPESLTHAFGVDFTVTPEWSFGVKAETGTLSDPLAGDITRKAIGLSASYRHDNTRLTTALEYRTDSTSRSTGLNSTNSANGVRGAVEADERRSWLMRNSLGLQLDPAWRLISKLNVARSVASKGAFYDGDYSEVVLGAAYRPVTNDRVNALLKYTYFYNLPASSQVDNSFGTPLDFKQKSHVINTDVVVDVTPWLSIGGKLGVRIGEVAASRTSDEWHKSRATLAVLRADWHWVREWDAIVEARRLAVREAGDARSGALVGVYRHVGQHAKIGVGYNFTRFSDDLTDMSYRSRGWFINALGTF